MFFTSSFFFFFHDPATTEIYTLSLHDALPIFCRDASRCILRPETHADRSSHGGRPRPRRVSHRADCQWSVGAPGVRWKHGQDRKSTRLNSSHSQISYAVFCLKKKKKKIYAIIY